MDNNGNNSDFSNIESVLNAIASCVYGGGYTGTSSLKVEQSSNSLALLENTIRSALNKDRKSSANSKENEEQKNEARHNVRILRDGTNSLNDTIKQLIKIEEEKNNKWYDVIRHPINFIAKNMPIIGDVLSVSVDLFSKFYSLQMNNLNAYNELISKGVLYQKSFEDLHKDAGEIGVTSKELKNAYIKNSQQLAILGGIYGNSTGSFNNLLKSIRNTSIAIGMDFNTSVDVAGAMIRTTFGEMEGYSNTFDKLIKSTEIYQKYLQKLSFATGKSAESILQEQKAREQDIAFKAWQKTGNNRMIADALTSIGATPDLIDAFVSGLPNAAFAKASASSPEMARILSRLMDISNDIFMSDKDKEFAIQDLFTNVDKRALSEPLGYNRAVLHFSDKGVQTGWNMGTNIVQGNWKEAFNYEGNNELIQQMQKLKNNFTGLIETILGKFSLGSKTLKAFEPGLNRINNFLEEMKKEDGPLFSLLNKIGEWFSKVTNGLIDDPQNSDSFMNRIKVYVFEQDKNKSWTDIFSDLLKPIFDGFKNAVWNSIKDNMGVALTTAALLFSDRIWGVASLIFKGLNTGYKLLSGTTASTALGGITSFLAGGAIGYELADLDDKMAKAKDKKTIYDRNLLYAKLTEGTITDEEIERLAKSEENGFFGTMYGGILNTIYKLTGTYNEKVEDLKQKRELAIQNHDEYVEKTQKDQAEAMKAREEFIKEQEKQKEELRKQLEETENGNKKSELECLRSIDTKLNILMNLDGKYNGLLNEAHILRQNQEFLNLTEMNPQET